jgi:hypothetical protein
MEVIGAKLSAEFLGYIAGYDIPADGSQCANSRNHEHYGSELQYIVDVFTFNPNVNNFGHDRRLRKVAGSLQHQTQ